MSAGFILVDEWIREAEDRRSSSTLAGELFFELPEIREATPDELAVDDAARSALEHLRAQWRQNSRVYRERRDWASSS